MPSLEEIRARLRAGEPPLPTAPKPALPKANRGLALPDGQQWALRKDWVDGIGQRWKYEVKLLINENNNPHLIAKAWRDTDSKLIADSVITTDSGDVEEMIDWFSWFNLDEDKELALEKCGAWAIVFHGSLLPEGAEDAMYELMEAVAKVYHDEITLRIDGDLEHAPTNDDFLDALSTSVESRWVKEAGTFSERPPEKKPYIVGADWSEPKLVRAKLGTFFKDGA